MQTLTSGETTCRLGRLICLPHAEPAAGAKHWRPIFKVIAVAEFERLKAQDARLTAPSRKQKVQQ